MRTFIHSTGLFCLACLTALTGCGTGIILRDISISLSAAVSIRANECFATVVQLSVPFPVRPALESYTLDLSASSGVRLYRSTLGCQSSLSTDEIGTIVLSNSNGARASFYARTSVEDSVTITTTARIPQGLSASITIPLAATRFTRTNGPNGAVASVLTVLENGQAYLSGSFTAWDRHVSPRLVRVNADGTADTSFQVPGSGFNTGPEAIAIQPDGKLLVVGQFTTIDGAAAKYIARLNPSGSVDSSFSTVGTGFDNAVFTVALAADGKVYVGGYFSSYNSTTRRYLARLFADGSLDPSFVETGTGLDWNVWKIVLQPDGKLIVGGGFFDYNGTFSPCVARIQTDGSLDSSFAQTGSGLDGDVKSIALQNDGRILVGGYFFSYNGATKRGIARLNSNGSLDSSFTVTGTGLNGEVESLALQADDKVLVGGTFSTYNGTSSSRAVRLNTDGTRDTLFTLPSTGFNANVVSVAIAPSGGSLLAGQFTALGGVAFSTSVVKLTETGSIDSTFIGNSIGFNSTLSAVAVQSDGSILVGANTNYSYDRTSVGSLSRLLSDGSLDTSFAMTGTGINNWVKVIRPQSDGQLVVAGDFNSYNGTTRNNVARLNADGTLDTAFATTGAGYSGPAGVLDIAVQPDGKVIVGGGFTSYNGTSRGRILRLNTNGSLDTTFVPTGTGFGGIVYCVAVQADGKIIAGGQFTTFNGTNRRFLARLNSDGSLDSSFAETGTGFNNPVNVVSLLPSGQLYAGGIFASYNGASIPGLARVNSDGSLDSSFVQSGSGLTGGVFGIARQSDGKIFVSGITGYATTSTRLARINTDGSLDTTFTVESPGFDNGLSGVALQSDGKVLVYGSFRSIGNGGASYFARLTSDGQLD